MFSSQSMRPPPPPPRPWEGGPAARGCHRLWGPAPLGDSSGVSKRRGELGNSPSPPPQERPAASGVDSEHRPGGGGVQARLRLRSPPWAAGPGARNLLPRRVLPARGLRLTRQVARHQRPVPSGPALSLGSPAGQRAPPPAPEMEPRRPWAPPARQRGLLPGGKQNPRGGGGVPGSLAWWGASAPSRAGGLTGPLQAAHRADTGEPLISELQAGLSLAPLKAPSGDAPGPQAASAAGGRAALRTACLREGAGRPSVSVSAEAEPEGQLVCAVSQPDFRPQRAPPTPSGQSTPS